MKLPIDKSTVFLSLLLIGLSALSRAFAQVPPPRGLENPDKTVERMKREDKARSDQLQADKEQRARKMDDLTKQDQRNNKGPTKNPLYVPGNVIAAEDVERYAKFLERPNSGIFRIFSNPGCKGSDCKPGPAARSDYSFINRQYVLRLFQEIGEFRNTLFSDGLYSQGIFVPLGDVPIEDVELGHSALKFLTAFSAGPDVQTFRAIRAQFFKDVESNGYRYSNSVPAQINTTYAARIIQYKLAQPLSSNVKKVQIIQQLLNSSGYSSRADIIVIFRVVRVDAESGYTTLVWKELRRIDAPELVLTNGDLLSKQ
jgi:hypothetical protein